MSIFQNALNSNISFEYLLNMRDLLSPVSLLSFFSVASHASSFHDNAGVLQYVNPKIGTYGLYFAYNSLLRRVVQERPQFQTYVDYTLTSE